MSTVIPVKPWIVESKGNACHVSPRGHQVQTATLFPCDSVFSFLVLGHETISTTGKSRSCNDGDILYRIQRETDARAGMAVFDEQNEPRACTRFRCNERVESRGCRGDETTRSRVKLNCSMRQRDCTQLRNSLNQQFSNRCIKFRERGSRGFRENILQLINEK